MTFPITPPPKWQIDAWQARIETMGSDVPGILLDIAQWGADQELEACCAILQQKGVPAWSLLRMHRRPKPPSLKEQALDELRISFDRGYFKKEAADTIRRALEQLDD